MKMLMLMLVAAVMLNGCSHLPSWMLKAHVEGYDYLHPDNPVSTNIEDIVTEPETPITVDPEPETEPDKRVAVVIDYSKAWTLKLTGSFKGDEHQRFIQTGTVRDGIDVFRWDGCFALRLYNDKIQFTQALQGSLSTPAPPNHWAMTTRQRGTASWNGTLTISYDPTGLCSMSRNGEQIGQWKFVIRKKPPTRRWVYLRGFNGTVEVTKE